ncbi:glutamate--tRNA ligase [Cognatishimia maritima]|uniref:Glutamate--tRNA ligase n=1 Tax=Cognatishimia maritima TaxID=870908 RepID=A0A1M5S489_9RHOB|nr:glutamate--tRNA ligase [Cognatishimia maritima]SHH33304.1 glutamyl-tRNA synthetase /glutamate--tRNA(Gln) ligase [Cognatishimia maritima]
MTTTRFAPSPTGYIHVGNLRTALMNFLIAKKAGGTFILRIDDTDPERSKQEYVDAIQEDLEWLGLTWDKMERQSERLDRYHAAADKLREMGKFYECFETPTELDLKRKKQLNMGKPPVYDRAALSLSDEDREKLREARGDGHWRFMLDQERINWVDGVLGELSIDAASVSDPVLIRGDGQFLYTLASVVDDIDMGVTHIVRGSDHVTNTATQIQMIETLGGTVPTFAHHSLLTGPQGESLSKRLGTLSLRDLRAAGVEPMALLSLMARLGSSQPVELRTSIDEIAEGFDISQFGSAPTKFDEQDLYPLTARLLAEKDLAEVAEDVAAAGVPSELAEQFWTVVRENITTRKDIAPWWALFANGADPVIDDEDKDFVAEAMAMLPDGPYDGETWGTWTKAVKDATGRKGRGLFMPLRKALTGQSHGPDMSAVLPLLQVIKARG